MVTINKTIQNEKINDSIVGGDNGLFGCLR